MEIMDKEPPWYKHLKVKEELKLDKHLVSQVIQEDNNSMQSLNLRLQLQMLGIDFDQNTDIKTKVYFKNSFLDQ